MRSLKWSLSCFYFRVRYGKKREKNGDLYVKGGCEKKALKTHVLHQIITLSECCIQTFMGHFTILLLSLIRKYLVDDDDDTPWEGMLTHTTKGIEAVNGWRKIRGVVNTTMLNPRTYSFRFYVLCFHMFVITHTNFNWIHCDDFEHVCRFNVPLLLDLKR